MKQLKQHEKYELDYHGMLEVFVITVLTGLTAFGISRLFPNIIITKLGWCLGFVLMVALDIYLLGLIQKFKFRRGITNLWQLNN